MVQTTSSTGAHQLGYIMFEDLQNKVYARVLDENVKDPEVRRFSVKNKGDIVESIMALGFIWQNTGSCNTELLGIMELVNHLENQMKAPQMRPSMQEEMDEQESLLPVNRKEFKMAIQLITDLSKQLTNDGKYCR
eukprot:1987452-Heterocapsa_arctica.AAC.1